MRREQKNTESLEEMMYRELFRVTDKCHSSMDTNLVLGEIIETLKRVFNENDYYLLLANDEEVDEELPVKSLGFDSAHDRAIAAYVHSTIEIETMDYPSIYAPLQGKQGVYGVLQVTSQLHSIFEDIEIDFIRLLANTAGNAIENAKLYQQSQKLIENLRLIDEIVQALNSISTYKEAIRYLHRQITQIFQSSEVGYVILKDTGPIVLQESSTFFKRKAGKHIVHFIYEQIGNDEESLFMGKTENLPNMLEKSVGSLMAAYFHSQSWKGFVILVGEAPYMFTFDMFRLFQTLVQRSSLSVINMFLREQLEKMVITDQLTQLFSRGYLDERIKASMQHDREGTFILIDLDDFKQVNDTYGHQTGDKVLIQVAELIQSSLRASDTAARWGGEELAVYLPGISLKSGLIVAERLRKYISEKTNPRVTISCGIACWGKTQAGNVSDLFSRADTALYEAKNSGKNQIKISS
ncbi:sensor domain-containing diguanylate cyclase [Bacillus sp. SD088]|uniref:sensor domain-containing diguanylate cyclase n=1 Tax=Bacillus sp. SD088 TaxID=2782012 RepID=UPI001A95B321|nr:sensor domain-containing diguanylate cyclase [Bacillus sp. SD088]MBO0992358.1 sensor domain-containing diguanylate cyclase [Bacillus sp. SD088]